MDGAWTVACGCIYDNGYCRRDGTKLRLSVVANTRKKADKMFLWNAKMSRLFRSPYSRGACRRYVYDVNLFFVSQCDFNRGRSNCGISALYISVAKKGYVDVAQWS